MSRKAGIGAIKNKSLAKSRYKEKRDELAENQILTLKRQFDQVRQSLELFASKHGQNIKEDPQLRSQFQAMCGNIGVDPLAYSRGCWSELLGLGEFYYHLGVRIIEVCLANQQKTGGLMSLKELIVLLNKNKSQYESETSADDVKRSIKRLKCLGTGFALVNLPGGQLMVQSIPGEMSTDQTMLLGLAESSLTHNISTNLAVSKFGWSEDRVQVAFQYLIQQGIAWVDDADPSGERVLWFPSLFQTAFES